MHLSVFHKNLRSSLGRGVWTLDHPVHCQHFAHSSTNGVMVVWLFGGQNFRRTTFFGGQNFSADKIFGSKSDIRQFLSAEILSHKVNPINLLHLRDLTFPFSFFCFVKRTYHHQGLNPIDLTLFLRTVGFNHVATHWTLLQPRSLASFILTDTRFFASYEGGLLVWLPPFSFSISQPPSIAAVSQLPPWLSGLWKTGKPGKPGNVREK